MLTRPFLTIGLSACLVLCSSVVLLRSADSKGRAKKGTSTERSSGSSSAGSAGTTSPEPADAESGGTPGQVVIHRQALHLRAPEKYQVSMQLEPVRTVRLAAPFDGIVKTVVHKSGDKLESGADVFRMDTTERQLLLDRAKALYNAAKIESQRAGSGGSGTIAKELADARQDAAKAELDLAVYRAGQGVVRAPFNAEVFRVDVSDGQIVRMGDPLATVGDTTTLRAEIPVDRSSTAPGQTLQIKVEDRAVPAKVDAVLPLATRFEPVRDLLPSAASAVVLFQNADGRLKSGQTVFSPLIPRDPIADVPNASIGNVPDGSHKVQVLRGNVVRDVPIATLAPIGADRTFISGPFEPTDELITSTSQELADGTPVTAALPGTLQQLQQKANGTGRGKSPGTDSSGEAPKKRAGF